MSIKLAVDCMLGKLAVWLRILGFDTHYLKELPLIGQPDRILLTCRSSALGLKKPQGWKEVVYLSEKSPDLLHDALSALKFTKKEFRPFTRCSVCNHELEMKEPADVAGMVPEYVKEHHAVFGFCPGCQRIYWPGTHHQNISKILDKL